MGIENVKKRLERLEQLSRKHGAIFTAILKDGTSTRVDAAAAICIVKDSAAADIRIDIEAKGCGQLGNLLADLLH